MKRALGLLLLVTVSLMIGACGYTLQGSGTVLPPDVKAIFIPKVQNNSTELGLSDTVTEALREQFESYGVVSVVDRQSLADAVLTVKILNVNRSTRTVLGSSDTATQMETTITLEGQLRRTNGALLWKNAMIRVAQGVGTDRSAVVTSSADFASGSISSSDLQRLSSRDISRSQESEILPNLAAEAARKIYDGAVAPDF